MLTNMAVWAKSERGTQRIGHMFGDKMYFLYPGHPGGKVDLQKAGGTNSAQP